MRSLVVVLLLALGAGCSSGDPRADRGPTATSTSSGSPSSSPFVGAAGDPADTPACAAVRAGIDAFNAGDYEGTVEHFDEAVPLAQAQLDGSQQARDLLEAVSWYAHLPPDDYLAASAGSSDFARYKAITLGQCVAPDDQPTGSPGTAI